MFNSIPAPRTAPPLVSAVDQGGQSSLLTPNSPLAVRGLCVCKAQGRVTHRDSHGAVMAHTGRKQLPPGRLVTQSVSPAEGRKGTRNKEGSRHPRHTVYLVYKDCSFPKSKRKTLNTQRGTFLACVPISITQHNVWSFINVKLCLLD